MISLALTLSLSKRAGERNASSAACYGAASTLSTAPSTLTTRTRAPTGRSGPSTFQIVSSTLILPVPLTIASVSAKTRPT